MNAWKGSVWDAEGKKDQQILRFERLGLSGKWIINDSKTE